MELMSLLAAVPRREASTTRKHLASLVTQLRASHAARTGVFDGLSADGRAVGRD